MRGDRVVVAGAEMDVGAQRPGLAPHHQRHLGVGLELDEAVDHLHAGALQVARPADVGLLVEARLELDQRGDRLAGLGRLDQRRDDRAVLAGAVERLLDRDHGRIARRLAQELHHDVEALVRMVDDDVLVRGSRRSSRRRNRGCARGSGHCRAGTAGRGARRRSAASVSTSPSSPSRTKTSSGATRQLGRAGNSRRSAGMPRVDREPDHAAAAPALQRALEGPHEILGLFLDLDVAVAHHAEQAMRRPARSREQAVEEQQRPAARAG